ncbi:small, acid-soluble spore protein, alpha/beta type [Metabacillus herbersteinensis]|uniref:Small, acid-soluble spore protein, alpha/beta type n=1 Tax=Metabacillus herbersteinensis TaxID=283816 RepID=A0ABV6GGV4_9BACI
MTRRNKLLVPEARQAVDQLKANVANTKDPANAKFEMANEVGVPLTKGNNGNLTSKEAGKVGGRLGGNMVREMVKLAEEKLKKQ